MEQPEKSKENPQSTATPNNGSHPGTDPHAKSQSEEEFRQTWKMKPKISHKLPSAFSSLQKGYQRK